MYKLSWLVDSFMRLSAKLEKKRGKIIMTRFQKEMRKRFPGVSFDEDMYGNKDAYVIEEHAKRILKAQHF